MEVDTEAPPNVSQNSITQEIIMDIEDIVKQIRLIDKSIAIAELEKDKLESQLLFYLEDIDANEFPDPFDVDGETVTVYRYKIKGMG